MCGTLHLADGEVLVEAVDAGEQEQLGHRAVQEHGRQTLEPAAPERRRRL